MIEDDLIIKDILEEGEILVYQKNADTVNSFTEGYVVPALFEEFYTHEDDENSKLFVSVRTTMNHNGKRINIPIKNELLASEVVYPILPSHYSYHHFYHVKALI